MTIIYFIKKDCFFMIWAHTSCHGKANSHRTAYRLPTAEACESALFPKWDNARTSLA